MTVGGALGNNLCEILNFIIQDEHKGTTCAPEDIGPCTFEKSFGSFIMSSLPPAVKHISSFVSSLHHHLTVNSVKGIGSQPSNHCDKFYSHLADKDMCILGIWKHSLCSVIDTQGGSSVDNSH